MRYCKKPVEVDAIQWTGDNLAEVARFVGHTDPPLITSDDFLENVGPVLELWVEKSNARCEIKPGGWVIAEADGQGHYPCTAEQFDATYEAVAP